MEICHVDDTWNLIREEEVEALYHQCGFLRRFKQRIARFRVWIDGGMAIVGARMMLLSAVFCDFRLEEDAFWLCSTSLEIEIDTQRDLYLVCKEEFPNLVMLDLV